MDQTARITRSSEITATTWRRLPMLLPRGVVIECTGLAVRELNALVASGKVRVHRACENGKAKYLKTDIGRLIGMET